MVAACGSIGLTLCCLPVLLLTLAFFSSSSPNFTSGIGYRRHVVVEAYLHFNDMEIVSPLWLLVACWWWLVGWLVGGGSRACDGSRGVALDICSGCLLVG